MHCIGFRDIWWTAAVLHATVLHAVITPALAATGPADNGRARTPPAGWRHWNQWNGAISQDIIEGNIRALADRSRMIDGVYASLADIGYSDAGIDDGWMKCGSYGPEKYRYHSGDGSPVIDVGKFSNLSQLTELAHSLNLTAGWYGNACGCAAQPYPQCCSDHCDTLECFAGDINATLAFGFDSYVPVLCGGFHCNRRVTNTSVRATPLGMMIENCHDDDGWPRGNEPYYEDDTGELWCPFHTYRTSGDARPTYGSLMNNLNSTRRLAENNLSVPDPDMMEVGVTASTSTMHDCGPNGTSQCAPLTVAEARTHFGAWAVVSSPLVLGFDLRNQTMVDLHWETITNTVAIGINQDYAGHSGSQFAQSAETVTLHACDWKAGVSCDWPTWTAWHKPLSARDARKSTDAVLVMNNGHDPARLSFSFAEIPGLAHVASCELYDVWGRKSLGIVQGPRYTTTEPVASHDSIFITLAGCTQ